MGTPLSGSNENIVNECKSLNEKTCSSNNLVIDLKAIEQQLNEKLKSTEDENNRLHLQIQLLNDRIRSQESQFARTVEEIKQTYNERLDKCTKDRDSARRDLESMVVKYAKSEKDVISIKKLKDDSERKLRDALKDKESFLSRIKALSADKTSLKNSLDQKIAEYLVLQKEVTALRGELKDKDSKLMEAQAILKSHIEENQSLRTRLNENPSENTHDPEKTVDLAPALTVTISTSESVSEDNKSDDLKLELKTLKEKFTSLENENHSLTLKVQTLERERLDHEEVVSKLKDSLNKLNSDYLAASIKLKDMEELKVAIQREKELVENTKNEVARLTELNNELTTEMESCRHKEGELLEFTERLTAKSVTLQAEHNALEEKCSLLEKEIVRLKKACDEAQKSESRLQESLAKECSDHETEVTLMARKVAEKNEALTKYKARKEELENEMKVMKKKHLNSIRELNKELLVMKKHMEECENKVDKSSQNNSETASNCSQSSSSSPNASNASNQSHPVNGCIEDAPSVTNSTDLDSIPNVDKQMLVNKIFRLQKAIAKKQEKIDFLEEHNHQLLQEMKKKTKLIQHYITREEAGALTTNRMDENKVRKSCLLSRED